jgi:hypothetical protein
LIKSKKLLKFNSITHAFFNRSGGKSTGIYTGLNCGLGSKDKKKNVLKNLEIVCKEIKCKMNNLNLLNQIHGTKNFFIHKSSSIQKRKTGDALITNKKGLALGVLTADCAPILVFDKKLKIIAAIHAGWKGAYKGIINKTLNVFKNKGSKLKNLYVVIGPCISMDNYEVKINFKKKFEKKNKKNNLFFKNKNKKIYFNLGGYILYQIKKTGVSNIELIKKDTFNAKNNFFSHRRSSYIKENDYGRNISIIMIK